MPSPLEALRAALGGALLGGLFAGGASLAAQETTERREQSMRTLRLTSCTHTPQPQLDALALLLDVARDADCPDLVRLVHDAARLVELVEANRAVLEAMRQDTALDNAQRNARSLAQQAMFSVSTQLYAVLGLLREGLFARPTAAGSGASGRAVAILWDRLSEVLTLVHAIA